MHQKQYTSAVILARLDFSEGDRVLTLLTPHLGKIRLMAKGVRKEKSKLAGGIELFSEVEVGFVTGRGELGTLVSSSLVRFYGDILKDIEKVQTMYKILKTFDKVTEDNAGEEYYDLLVKLLRLANEPKISYKAIDLYFKAQLLNITGYSPNLRTDSKGEVLKEDGSYTFDFDSMSMAPSRGARYKAAHLKYLRLLFADTSDKRFFKLSNTDKITTEVTPLIDAMMKSTLSI